jgi:uncharacterized protein with FMN-binding domain
MSHGGSNKKVSNSLVALSSAAILAVYAAGYSRTRSAADRFTVQTEERRPAIPVARDDVARPASTEVTAPAAPVPSDLKREMAVRRGGAESSQPSPPPAQVSSAAPAPSTVETPAAISPPAVEPAPVIAELKAEPKVEAPAAAPAAPPQPVWKDGTYTGWGYSRHGDIQASVVIEGGRIASATIAQCLTRYSCSVIDKLPPEVAQRQSPDVDYVSGATQSANAFYYGVVEALAKAK